MMRESTPPPEMRSLWFHLFAFCVAAGAAYFAWTTPKDDDTKAEAPAPLLAADTLKQVSYRDGETRVDIAIEGKKDAYSAIVTYVGPEKKDDDHADDDGHGHGERHGADAGVVENKAPEKPTLRTDVFPAAKNVIRALTQLAPLVPRRVVGAAPDEKLKKMGLDGNRTLDLKASGESLTLELGTASYGGAAQYARLTNGDVILVEARALKTLGLARERMMKRRLFDVDLGDVTGLEAEFNQRRVSYRHEMREQRKKRYFTVAGGDGERSEEAQSIANELRTLRVNRYVEDTALSSAKAVAKVTVVLADGRRIEGALYEAADGNGYLLKSGRWIGEVSLARGRALVEELSLAVPLRATPPK